MIGIGKGLFPSLKSGKHAFVDPTKARQKLQSATSLHIYHWAILSASLVLSIFAWQFAQANVDAQMRARFERESIHTIELIKERMLKYEDALQGGVAMINAAGGHVSCQHWNEYATDISIEHKYPGINGIGVIHRVPRSSLAQYLKEHRWSRPNFKIYPEHEKSELYPISYIVPLKGNENAVGLDMAHEENRYSAAKLARDSGLPQITGPISLVQDTGKTSGFLFYTPFYSDGSLSSLKDRRDNFAGLVYAPFVVNKLMQGTLEKDKRHVGIRLLDGAEKIYDEHTPDEEDFDSDPLYRFSSTLNLYGRMWTFEIWSTKSFREASSSSQPLLILLGGIFIDLLLLFLFLSISRSSGMALNYADAITARLKSKSTELEKAQQLTELRARQLETSNAELEQFACIASHDLQEPLRKVASYCELLGEDYGDILDEDGQLYIGYAIDGAKRMRTLIQDLLEFSKISSSESDSSNDAVVETEKCCKAAIFNLQSAIDESEATIVLADLPRLVANERHVTQLLQNLIGNAIKYRSDNRPEIFVDCESSGAEWTISVSDNGIGIAPEFHQRVFGIFKRLHGRQQYPGTGIGLAICQRIVERWNGRIWIDPDYNQGCKICFTAAKNETELSQLRGEELVAVTN